MKFFSTNNKDKKVSFRHALLKGMPQDNGLYMPETIPDHSSLIKGIEKLSIQDISFVVSQSMLSDDFNNADIEEIVHNSISFDSLDCFNKL